MMDNPNISKYLKKHIEEITANAKKDFRFSWDEWKKAIDPIIELSDALSVNTEEIKRAKEAYINAQIHLKFILDQQIVYINKTQNATTHNEDLT